MEALALRSAWYRLEASDNDPARFGSYQANALNLNTESGCPNTLKTLQGSGFDNLEALFTSLLAELEPGNEPLFLVLDDYHRITNPDVHEAVRFLLRHLPVNLHLVIVSRTLPPIGVAQLRMQGLLTEITSRDLALAPMRLRPTWINDCP